VYTRKIITIIILLLFGVTAVGCSKIDRLQMKQAKDAFKAGNMKASINATKAVLKRSPRNIFAKRFMSKLETKIIESAKTELEKKEYQKAAEQAETLLDELNPQNEEAKTIRADAKKYLLYEQARKASQKNPIFGLKIVRQALKFDPEFKEALELQAEIESVVQEQITKFMATARDLFEQERYEELMKLTQQVLSIEPNHQEASALLKETIAKKLARDQQVNLNQAIKFFEEGIYESAKAKAELVLKGNRNNDEAKKLVEKSIAEMKKPKLRLTGFTKIKGDLYAQILIQGNPQRFRVREGEEFGDFKVVIIDYDLKSIVLTYTKTGSQLSLTLGEE